MKNLMKRIFRDWKSSLMFFVIVGLVLLLVSFMVFGMIKHSINKNKENIVESVEERSSEEAETSETAPVVTEPVETEEETEETVEETEPEAVFGNYEHLFVVTGAETLNIREIPSTEGAVIGALKEFSGGNVIEKTEDGLWYHIQSGALEGYVSADYVVVGKEAMDLAEAHKEMRIRITEEVVNIRSSASPDADILGSAERNAVFSYLSEENGFYVIQFDAERLGYVSNTVSEAGWYLQEAIPVDRKDETEESAAEENAQTETEATSAQTPAGPNGHVVCIDPGHQAHGMSEQEPNGPGSGVMKAKLTTGTAGCATGRAEHVVNLEVSLRLQQELVNRGYSVVMIRTSADCPVSNAERAQIANNSGAECFIRIHCNSSVNPAVQGTMNYAPSGANPYLSQNVINGSNALASTVLNSMCAATGWQSHGVLQDDTMTGINWCQIPVTIVEMGFMSNPTDDQMLSDPAWQALLAKGMADGIDAYFGR